jgi:hypothetical protein
LVNFSLCSGKRHPKLVIFMMFTPKVNFWWTFRYVLGSVTQTCHFCTFSPKLLLFGELFVIFALLVPNLFQNVQIFPGLNPHMSGVKSPHVWG